MLESLQKFLSFFYCRKLRSVATNLIFYARKFTETLILSLRIRVKKKKKKLLNAVTSNFGVLFYYKFLMVYRDDFSLGNRGKNGRALCI